MGQTAGVTLTSDPPMREPVRLDDELAYRALESRDGRFDGRVWFGVTTTGIYCRPVCPAQTPKRPNVRFFASPAAAVAAGFRACRRCRPDSAPGSREWDHRSDLVARALRGIAEGAVDEAGVTGLAARLHVSERHLHRTLIASVGVGPLQLATSRRAQTARLLIDETTLPITDIAFAAGFTSIRQFNDVMRQQFGLPPSQLRRTPRTHLRADDPDVVLRLNYREPYDLISMGRFLAGRTLRGVEEHVPDDDPWTHRRALRLRHSTVNITVSPIRDKPQMSVRVPGVDLRDIAELVARVRRWLDLDADPASIVDVLGNDDALAPLIAARPGARVAQTPDAFEGVVRTVVGQQISVAGAITLLGRVVAAFGAGGTTSDTSEDRAASGLRHAARLMPFPTAEQLAEVELADWRSWGFTTARAQTLMAMCESIVNGELDLGADRDEVAVRLRAIKGIGPWSTSYVALRVLGDPDAFPATDLVVRRTAAALGIAGDDLLERAEGWRPWRAYATTYLWNHQPTASPNRPTTPQTDPPHSDARTT